MFRLHTGYPVFFTLFLLAGFDPAPKEGSAQTPDPEALSTFDVERVLRADGSPGPYLLSDRQLHEKSERVWLDGKVQDREKGGCWQKQRHHPLSGCEGVGWETYLYGIHWTRCLGL